MRSLAFELSLYCFTLYHARVNIVRSRRYCLKITSQNPINIPVIVSSQANRRCSGIDIDCCEVNRTVQVCTTVE